MPYFLLNWILKVFEIDDMKAWKSVLISVTSYVLGLVMISKSPWFLLPLAWAWTGTAITGVSAVNCNISSKDCFFFFLLICPLVHPANSFYFVPFSSPSIVKFFVIGHDCAHKSFSKNKLVEDIVGTLAFLPLIYPYEPWRFKHDQHHAKTNM